MFWHYPSVTDLQLTEVLLHSCYFPGGHRGGRPGYDRGGNGGRYEDRGSRDGPGSHANFGRRDRRDSDRRPPPENDFREATAGK